MYESPIDLIVQQIAMGCAKKFDNAIDTAIQSYGVNVAKDELIKALQYDRDQYNKGYADGLRSLSEWISVSERLPEREGKYLVCTTKGHIGVGYFIDYYGKGKRLCFDDWAVSHWMPLPEPPKGENR